jgi:hypothetical protein
MEWQGLMGRQSCLHEPPIPSRSRKVPIYFMADLLNAENISVRIDVVKSASHHVSQGEIGSDNLFATPI